MPRRGRAASPPARAPARAPAPAARAAPPPPPPPAQVPAAAPAASPMMAQAQPQQPSLFKQVSKKHYVIRSLFRDFIKSLSD